MKGFDFDPDERAFVRSKIPPELIATVDNAEARMNEKVDGLVSEFKSSIQEKIVEFTERDFSAELEENISALQEELVSELSTTSNDLSKSITAVNKAIKEAGVADDAIKSAVEDLKTAQNGLNDTLNGTREKAKALGGKTAKSAKSAVSKFLTGLF